MSSTDDNNDFVNVADVVEYSVPTLKNWKTEKFYHYKSAIFDYENIVDLNSSINSARQALFEVNDAINVYERREVKAKAIYDREHRRKYISSNEKTESAKKARADLQCEDLEDDVIVYGQIKSELYRLSNTLRLELQTLQSIGNNLRQQIKMED